MADRRPGAGQDQKSGAPQIQAPARVVAATWLCWRGDAVLAVRPRGSAMFFLPGGVPEQGETLARAAAREVREEVGVVVAASELTEVVRVEADAYGRPGVVVDLVCFAGPGAGEPVPGGQEIVQVAWLEPLEWRQFAPAVRLALTRMGREGARGR